MRKALEILERARVAAVQVACAVRLTVLELASYAAEAAAPDSHGNVPVPTEVS